MSIGKRMRSLRESLDMTQGEVAQKVGVATQTIFKYENEIVTNIPLDKLEKIADALHSSVAFLMGWEESNSPSSRYPAPGVTDSFTSFPVVGEIAAGYDFPAIEDWDGEVIDVPDSYLHGRPREDYFVLKVKGDSMFPAYQDGDLVLILRQETLNYSGQIGAVLYNGDSATLKRVEYVMGEDWMNLVPINPSYPPLRITGPDLELCHVLGIPKLLIRNL